MDRVLEKLLFLSCARNLWPCLVLLLDPISQMNPAYMIFLVDPFVLLSY